MSINEFLESVAKDSSPPENLSPEQRVLWLTKAGHWHAAHDLAQNLPDPNGAWLHGLLHRIEGDTWNANYWYSRAKQTLPPDSLSTNEELMQLARHFLD